MALSSAAIVQVEGRMGKAALMLSELFWIQTWMDHKDFRKLLPITKTSPKTHKMPPDKPRGLTKLLKPADMGDPTLQKRCLSWDAAVTMGEILWIFYVIF